MTFFLSFTQFKPAKKPFSPQDKKKKIQGNPKSLLLSFNFSLLFALMLLELKRVLRLRGLMFCEKKKAFYQHPLDRAKKDAPGIWLMYIDLTLLNASSRLYERPWSSEIKLIAINTENVIPNVNKIIISD